MHDDDRGPPVPPEQVLPLLESGRSVLRAAADHYGRPLGPAEYWWLGVALAAVVLAEMNGQTHVADRVEALAAELAGRGITDERAGRMINELAILDSLGMMWPVYRRSPGGWERDPAVELAERFGPEEAYWLGLAHVAAALLQRAGRGKEVPGLADVLGELVTEGLSADHERRVLALFHGMQST